jgi:ketosteroid isomerase-like protein
MTMPDTTVDRAALRDLIDQYHAAINHRDFTLLAGVFASDAVWEALAPINLHFEGRDAVLEGLRQSVGRQELLVQSSSGVVITLRDARTASIRSTLTEIGRERDGGAGWEAVGFYDDEARKDDDGVWRFVRRTFRVRYMGPRGRSRSGKRGALMALRRLAPLGRRSTSVP